MAVVSVKIHPAIGIARVGNSPDEFFVGPERLWETVDPQGGFKDADCRIKRQAARFRVFAYHDDDSVEELTAADANITWTVHLANRKAASRNAGSAADLTIDPGPRTLDGPDQRAEFDNGQITLPGSSSVTVPLGEVRTDDEGRLLVLGGFGTSASPTNAPINSFLDNPGWYDDVSDGPVTAHVTLAAGGEFDAAAAWVIAAPPKFAPQLDNVITLYDRIFDVAVAQGWLTAPPNPSYTADVYPILQRARTTQWVIDVFGAHGWPDPVYDPGLRLNIFNRLANPAGGGGDMPQLQAATLTSTQYGVMQNWKDGTFVQDWAEPPPPAAQVTAHDLDVTALTHCVGAAFFPGIEAGGIAATPIIEPSSYLGAADPMRLDPAALGPGGLTEHMALPWQADFWACGTNWWPVPRPNEVIPEGTGTRVAWDRDVNSMLEMVTEWNLLGFVVKQGDEYVEVDRCDTTFIALITPHVHFQDVPQGAMGMSRKVPLAISFEVRSTSGPVTLEVQPGDEPAHPRLKLDSALVSAGPTAGSAIATARLWVLYETGPVGELLIDEVTVKHGGSGRSWTVGITASTAARTVAATALVLDRSGSMSEDRGDGQSKHASLQQAAAVFVDVMLEGDGVGIVRYNEDAQALQAVTTLGPAGDPFDAARQNTKDIIFGPELNPSGATSIGDGIYEGRQILNAAAGGYDVESLVVITDGNENRARWIADVAGEINEQTYAVGIGRPENTSAAALQTVSGNHGGYLLMTGAIAGDNRFVLQKYFLQILAGISNAEIVLDPQGTLVAGQEQRIPFQLSEADAGVDVILLTDHPKMVDFRVETPNGLILEPWRSIAEPDMVFSLTDGVAFYRFALPAELVRARYDHAGIWHALLTIGRPRTQPPVDTPGEPVRSMLPIGRADVSASALTQVADREGPALMRRIPPRTGAGARIASAPDEAVPGAMDALAAAGRRPRMLPYSLLVHAYSNLSLRARVEQAGYELGAVARIIARIAESGLPPAAGAAAWAEITRPDDSTITVELQEGEAGAFEGVFTMSESGVHRYRVRASGHTRAGNPWQREQTLTAAVWRGGDHDADPANSGGGPVVRWLDEERERWCQLLLCMTGERTLAPEVQRRLRETGIDLDGLRNCLKHYCRSDDAEDG